MRTGIYKQMLRTPLTVELAQPVGILSGSGTSPLVRVTGGSLAISEVQARIQVIRDIHDGDLRINLLDMEEGGQEGDELRVNANSTYTLSGWTGSNVTSLEITVDDYDGLLALVKTTYAGRLVDVLYLSMGS